MPHTPSASSAILSAYPRMSDAERRIASFILSSDVDPSALTAGEIARACDTSNTTMSRFVKTVGFDSFALLRLALAREAVSRQTSSDDPDTIYLGDVAGSARMLLANKRDELEDTLEALDVDAVHRVVELLLHAGTAMFVGAGSSLSFAQMAAVKFSQVGIRAVSPASTDAASILATLLGPADLVVFVSNSGHSARLDRIMENARESAARTVVLTCDADSPLARNADVLLLLGRRDQLLAKDFMFSHNSANFVTELLLMLVYHESMDVGVYMSASHRSLGEDKATE